ncbi:hypothetical protein CN680_07550 [Bacillus pseudomycoides]|uniref:hypothetical protein n=1 Tax=Bacillus pseudomycoides TaxID=64104 RepID=UPI000BEC7C8D|nr:hypothetical protein [Bacillus pseudomycoides]PED71318.1 hypothetical protein CON97_14790 [Bacillus pseudomycoides]PEI40591.1 hypothetical protein CN620_15140 [Bacillus pseudomycoides]PEJ79985.1 hypothetical protein CN680_07550 [Bacillus pseudomycoides]PEM13174.1 hypothetical protein CN628_19390 [Bacillus pseudomycoides]PEO98749.1 hypothetical protein CN550_14360 [Bacillus pseudomycoides]
MPFKQGINQIQTLTTNALNKKQYVNKFYPARTILPDLVLLYPGRINNHGDYRLEFKGRAVSHPDVVRAVYDCTRRGYGRIITNFLVDLYTNGLNANSNFTIDIYVNNTQLSLSEFKQLAYWIVLQEDINFPRPQKMGVRMPLIRYIEGAISALHPNLLSLNEVINRTNNHGRPPQPAFIHNDVMDYLTQNIQAI